MLCAVALFGTVLATVSSPASGSLVSAGSVRPGHTITVIHNIDAVFLSGYEPLGTPVAVEVRRGGVVIGSAAGPTIETADGIGLEINHGPLGPPVAGDCWDRVTPDILPGDRIVVRDGTATDEVFVDDITFSGPARLDLSQPAPQDVIVDGVAKTAAGAAIDVATLAGEFRGTNAQDRAAPDSIEAVPGTPGGFRLRYSGADGYPFFRNGPATAAERQALLISGDGHSVAAGIAVDVQMVDGIEDASGPGPGCEGVAPAAADAVTATVPAVINRDAVAAGAGNVQVSGVSVNASLVELSMTSSGGGTAVLGSATPTPAPSETDLSVRQTWSTTLPIDQVRLLGDGTLTIAMTVTRITGAGPTSATLAGRSATLVKDTVAPALPSASPPAGTYIGSQQVTVTPGAGTDALRFVLGTTSVLDPTASDSLVSGQIAVTSSQTLKARGFDNAGNAGPVLSAAYTINQPTAPAAPAAPAASAGAGRADLTWAVPANGGSSITGYRVRWFVGAESAPSGSTVVGVPAASITGLTNGTPYTFDVAAINGVGTGAASARSAAVTPLSVPGAPTIGAATAGDRSASIAWTPPSSNGGTAITGYRVTTFGGSSSPTVTTLPATSSRLDLTGLVNGTAYNFEVVAVNAVGTGPASGRSNTVTPAAPPPLPAPVLATLRVPPSAPVVNRVQPGSSSATVSWSAPSELGSGNLRSYEVQVFRGDAHVRTTSVGPSTTRLTVGTLENGQDYRFRVRGISDAGAGSFSAWSASVTPALTPDPPTLRVARSGAPGGSSTARARWLAPAEDGGSDITGYLVIARKLNPRTGAVVLTERTGWLSGDRLAKTMRLSPGTWGFKVRARNEVGASVPTPMSNLVRAR